MPMTSDELIITAIVETVPQLYSATSGPYSSTHTFGTHTINKYSHRALTPALRSYLETCKRDASQLVLTNPIHEEVEFERVQQFCASIWLKEKTGINTWPKIFDYFSKLQKRTIENNTISKSIIIDRNIDPATSTQVDMSSPAHHKVSDWIGSSPFAYLRVTPDLHMIKYESIKHSDIPDPTSYQFIPGFLLPIASQLTDTPISDILITSNQKGDLVITNKTEILASRRKGKWTIYDPATIKNTIHDCMKEGARITTSNGLYGLACTLFQVLFDMSFKRHGGLILIDSDLNSFSSYTSSGVVRRSGHTLTDLLPQSSLGTITPDQADIRRLTELSAIDGAIIVDQTGSIEGFGLMVNQQGSLSQTYGARTAAARAAVNSGAVAFKVSSDGEISVFFQTQANTGSTIHEIKFL